MGSSVGKCQVDITTDKPLYTPGQVICGKLHVVNPKPYEHRGITVQCEGFVEGVGGVAGGRGSNVKGANSKLHHLKILKSVSKEGVLSEGHHTFPVVFPLPSKLPSSSYKVTYKLTANLGGVSKKDTYNAYTPFKVHGNCVWNKSLVLKTKV